MKYAVSKRAVAQVQRIREYISRDNPPAADSIFENLIESFERLVVHPFIGHLGRRAKTREFVVAPFVVVYRVGAANRITILAMLHGKPNYQCD